MSGGLSLTPVCLQDFVSWWGRRQDTDECPPLSTWGLMSVLLQVPGDWCLSSSKCLETDACPPPPSAWGLMNVLLLQVPGDWTVRKGFRCEMWSEFEVWDWVRQLIHFPNYKPNAYEQLDSISHRSPVSYMLMNVDGCQSNSWSCYLPWLLLRGKWVR